VVALLLAVASGYLLLRAITRMALLIDTTLEQVENRVRCDLFYIDNWSLLFDLKIAAMTILREIFGLGPTVGIPPSLAASNIAQTAQSSASSGLAISALLLPLALRTSLGKFEG
jgi:Bacterial sugar transferase